MVVLIIGKVIRLNLWKKWVPEIFLGVKRRLTLKAGNLTAIYEPIVYKMRQPRRLKTLWASTACLPFTLR
jgi:hypothetical protein